MATPTQDRDSDSKGSIPPRHHPRSFPLDDDDGVLPIPWRRRRHSTPDLLPDRLPDRLPDLMEPTFTLELNEDYFKALKLGEVLLTYARLMMIGPGGAGKTSLQHGLMNIKLPELPTSTPLANATTVKCHQWASAGAQCWTEIDEDSEISELAAHLLKLLASEETVSTHNAASVEVTSQGGYVASDSSEAEITVKRILINVSDRIKKWSIEHQDKQSEVLIHLWDSGGQRVFLDILPAFLTSRTVFMLVFNAAVELERKLQVDTVREGRIVHTEDYHLSTIKLLLQWMASIHAHLSRQNPDGKPMNFPRILLLGTHKDQLSSTVTKNEVFGQLHSQYKDKTYADWLMPSPWFLVDNTTAGQSENEDPEFKELRQQVFDFAAENFTVPTPVSWVLFRKVLQSISRDNSKPVISYEETKAVAKACAIPVTALPSVLNFYHDLGVFLWYKKIEGLNRWIIADPRWLISQLAKLLSPQGLHDHSQERQWKLLYEQGILVETLYKQVWDRNPVGSQYLVDLLEHFLLAAKIETTGVHPYSGKEYFVPCMLNVSNTSPQQGEIKVVNVPNTSPQDCTSPLNGRISTQEKATNTRQKAHIKAEPIHLIFDTNYVPPGFFVRLLASITCDSDCRILFRKKLNRYRVVFAYRVVDEVTLSECSESVVVEIVRPDQRGFHVDPLPTVCRKVFTLLSNSFASVRKWLPSLQVKTAFKCTCCQTLPHFLPFDESTLTTSGFRCMMEELCFPTKDQKCWLKPETEVQHVLLHDHPLVHEETLHVSSKSQRQTSGQVGHVDSLVACARYIKGDITFLATALGISDTELSAIQSRYKPQGQALQLLQLWWKGSQGGNKDKLAEILKNAGYEEAVEELLSAKGAMMTLQLPEFSQHTEVKDTKEKPTIQQFQALKWEDDQGQIQRIHIKHEIAAEWREVGIALGIDTASLNAIAADCKGVAHCAEQLFAVWEKKGSNFSWDQLIEALKDANFINLARDIRNALPNKV